MLPADGAEKAEGPVGSEENPQKLEFKDHKEHNLRDVGTASEACGTW